MQQHSHGIRHLNTYYYKLIYAKMTKNWREQNAKREKKRLLFKKKPRKKHSFTIFAQQLHMRMNQKMKQKKKKLNWINSPICTCRHRLKVMALNVCVSRFQNNTHSTTHTHTHIKNLTLHEIIAILMKQKYRGSFIIYAFFFEWNKKKKKKQSHIIHTNEIMPNGICHWAVQKI